MKNYRPIILNNINSLISLKSLTAKEFAQAIGKKNGIVTDWRTGRSFPSIDDLIVICTTFNCTLDTLLPTELFNTPSFSADEIHFMRKYQQLPLLFKQKIDTFIEIASIDVSTPNTSVSSNIENDEKATAIPILGYVAAGSPIIAYENPLSFVNTYNRLVSYALFAKGNSMEPVIYDGEIIEIEKTDTLENGDIGIIQIDEEVTCKKFYRYSDRIELVSFNSDFEPIQIFKKDLKNVQILGKVVLNDVQNRRL